jgi:hypothetical protein
MDEHVWYGQNQPVQYDRRCAPPEAGVMTH